MNRSIFIALALIVCGVTIAGTGAFAEQAADPSGVATPNGASDATLEIAPSYPQPVENQPGSSDAGTVAPQTEGGSAAAPDAGTAQDYATNQGSNAAPLPNFAGIDDYVNQQTSYESVSTGLPPIALLPPPAYYPYYYPGFYSWARPPMLMMPPPHYAPPPPPPHRPPPPPPPYHPPPPPPYHPLPPPAHRSSVGPPPGHGGFQHR